MNILRKNVWPAVWGVLLVMMVLMTAAMVRADPLAQQPVFAQWANPLGELSARNYRLVVDEVAGQVLEQLPDNIHFRLLAISRIEGDDGALADTLTGRIKAETNYHLIERRDLDKILAEQGIQLSPIADPRTPVEPGRIQGVEGLLLGEVRNRNCSPFYCSLEVFLKLNNVESGEVVFARSFSASYLPASTIYGGIGALVSALLLALLLLRKRGRLLENQLYIRKDDTRLLNMQSDLRQARANLEKVHDQLVATDKMALSTELRAAKEEVGELLARLERTPGLHPEMLDWRNKGGIKSNTRSLTSLVKDIRSASEKVIKVAGGSESQLSDALNKLQTETREAANRLQARPAGRA